MNYPKIKIIIRTDRINADGMQSLRLRYTHERTTKYFTLPIKVFPKDWNEKKSRIKYSAYNSVNDNLLIDSYEKRAKDIIFEHQINNKPLTLEQFKKRFEVTETKNDNSFFYFVAREMELVKNLNEPATYKSYKSQIKKLSEYQKDIDFNDITIDFLDKYKTHLVKIGNNDNTISKSMKIIKVFIKKAIQKEVIEKSVFDNYRLKSHDANVEYLTLVECDYLLQMLNTDKLTDSENKFLHYFLFSCFMGLRLEDVKALTYRNIKTEIDKENNKTYFLVTSLKKSKYKTTVKIPLHNRVLLLIDLNSLPDLKIFRGFCNQGKYLKPIIKKAGIDKDLHFHCSRHTFTNILSELGIPPEVAQVILGHSDIQTTMKHYYRVSDQRTIENMKKWDCV